MLCYGWNPHCSAKGIKKNTERTIKKNVHFSACRSVRRFDALCCSAYVDIMSEANQNVCDEQSLYTHTYKYTYIWKQSMWIYITVLCCWLADWLCECNRRVSMQNWLLIACKRIYMLLTSQDNYCKGKKIRSQPTWPKFKSKIAHFCHIIKLNRNERLISLSNWTAKFHQMIA